MIATAKTLFKRLMDQRTIVVRFLIGAQSAYLFACWLVQLPQAHSYFVDFLPWPESLIWSICSAGFASAGLFAFGVRTRISALALFVCLQTLLLLYPWPKEIHTYVSFSLLIYALFAMKNGSMSTDFWRLPFLLAIYLGFTISGVSKLFYPGWWDGEVIYALLTSHIVGPGWSADFVRQLPTRGIAYLTIAIEGLSLPLALWARTRKTAWWLNTFLHLGVLIIWRIGPVALGTLTVQLLIYPDKKLDEKK